MVFKTAKQRKKVMGYKLMAKLRKLSPKVRTYNGVVHIRVRKPVKKAKYRVLDIGKPKRHQLTRMKVKGKPWRTQKVMVTRKALSPRTLQMVKRAKKY